MFHFTAPSVTYGYLDAAKYITVTESDDRTITRITAATKSDLDAFLAQTKDETDGAIFRDSQRLGGARKNSKAGPHQGLSYIKTDESITLGNVKCSLHTKGTGVQQYAILTLGQALKLQSKLEK